MSFNGFARRTWPLALLLAFGHAHAGTFDITIGTSFLGGSPAVLVFDLIDGGPPDNAVTVDALASDGVQGPISTIGNVTGTGPWTLSDAGGSFFNELQIPFDPTGASVSFSFTTSNNPPGSGSLPDAFSFFILGLDLLTPLVTTDDPTGADAIFLYSAGKGAAGLSVYAADQSDFSIQVASPQSVPEPGALDLLLAAVMALAPRCAARGGRPRTR
jgi:hypothetical protein